MRAKDIHTKVLQKKTAKNGCGIPLISCALMAFLGVRGEASSRTLIFCPLLDGRKGPAMKKQWTAYADKYP